MGPTAYCRHFFKTFYNYKYLLENINLDMEKFRKRENDLKIG